jgi:hypothetical protein
MQRWGTACTLPNFCVALCIFMLFYVLFVCICVLYYCYWVATQLQLNISYHILWSLRSQTVNWEVYILLFHLLLYIAWWWLHLVGISCSRLLTSKNVRCVDRLFYWFCCTVWYVSFEMDYSLCLQPRMSHLANLTCWTTQEV